MGINYILCIFCELSNIFARTFFVSFVSLCSDEITYVFLSYLQHGLMETHSCMVHFGGIIFMLFMLFTLLQFDNYWLLISIGQIDY